MNVIIIDDQTHVVNGLYQGINWKRLNIERVWTANSAEEAKQVIQREHIHIMLCDIEMPGDDGLSLFRWVKNYDGEIECIFLTAHADFEFAKEALRLGSFDYILQPAPYEEIEEAIRKVSVRIRRKAEMSKFSLYGRKFYKDKEVFLESLLKEWVAGNRTVSEVIKRLENFQIYFDDQTDVDYCVLQVIHREKEYEKLEEELFRYAVGNILSEIFEQFSIKVLICHLEQENYGVLFYGKMLPQTQIVRVLEDFQDLCRDFYGCSFALYLGKFTDINGISQQIETVNQMQKDNVAYRSGIFVKSSNFNAKSPDRNEKIREWSHKLAGGKADSVKNEIIGNLEKGTWDAWTLKQFYLEFMQSVFSACEELSISNHQIFEEQQKFEDSLNAWKSIYAMKELVIQIADYFCQQRQKEKDHYNYIESVIQYIHSNIEKDMRRGEIAAAINLNEDYLSRLFKKQKGISLKEYIIQEKMKTAQTLLRNTDFSVSMIGAKVGFTNFSHFSQTYKKVMGKTPVEEKNHE